MQVGCDAATAEGIASGNQGIDDNPITSPFSGGLAIRQAYHFTEAQWRDYLWKKAMNSDDPAEMGKYMHAMQDSFSHQRGKKNEHGRAYGPGFGHIWTSDPDDPRLRPELWKRMLDRTTGDLWLYCGSR